MTDPRNKRDPGQPPGPAGERDDRPTVSPPFDLEAFARESTGQRPPRPPAVPRLEAEPRQREITLTNELELEQARSASTRTDPPERSNLLSLADARAPSSSKLDAVTGPPPRSLTPARIEAAAATLGSSAPPEITERTIDDPVAEMRERFSLGDYTGALEMAELILAEEPGNLEAAECGENCRGVLENMYAARLGALDRAPIVVVPRTQMRWLSMDHRAGFILSLIDGSSTVDMILDVCGMPRLDALRILYELVQQKIVSFR